MTSPGPAAARNIVVPLMLRQRPVPREAVRELRGETMGTTWSVKAPLEADAIPAVRQAVEGLLENLVRELSAWEPHSALSRFNSAQQGWHQLPESLCAVLARALEIAKETEGAYDPTIWPLVELWGFGPAGAIGLPQGSAIAEAKRRCGFCRVGLDRAARRAWQPGGAGIDVCSIAKGYAVDRLSELLSAAGIDDHLVEIGGELRGEGVRPDGNPWWIEVESPPLHSVSGTIIALHGLAVATSGDYRRWFDYAGRRVSHLLDPRLGLPVENDLLSVTVLQPDCLSADAFATALFVLGSELGMPFAESRGIPALFMLKREARVGLRATSAFLAMSN